MLHSVYDQPDPASVNAQFDRLRPGRHSRVHRVPQGRLAAGLVKQPQRAFEQGNPPPHRRRRDLPNRDAITRLVGAVLAEQSDEWAEGCRYFGLEVLARCRLTVIDPGDVPHTDLPALESMEIAA
jgi:hypothetical protein